MSELFSAWPMTNDVARRGTVAVDDDVLTIRWASGRTVAVPLEGATLQEDGHRSIVIASERLEAPISLRFGVGRQLRWTILVLLALLALVLIWSFAAADGRIAVAVAASLLGVVMLRHQPVECEHPERWRFLDAMERRSMGTQVSREGDAGSPLSAPHRCRRWVSADPNATMAAEHAEMATGRQRRAYAFSALLIVVVVIASLSSNGQP